MVLEAGHGRMKHQFADVLKMQRVGFNNELMLQNVQM